MSWEEFKKKKEQKSSWQEFKTQKENKAQNISKKKISKTTSISYKLHLPYRIAFTFY